jgi:hypothetical protein
MSWFRSWATLIGIVLELILGVVHSGDQSTNCNAEQRAADPDERERTCRDVHGTPKIGLTDKRRTKSVRPCFTGQVRTLTCVGIGDRAD